MSKKTNDSRKCILFLGWILFITIFLFSNAFAQEYPNRPIKIIIPYGPGGVNALVWRTVGDAMAKILGQPVIIENKPGGGMTIAFTLVANAKPDGYTAGAGPASALTNSYLAYETKYHPTKSFTLIGGVLAYNQIFLTKADSRWKTWKEFHDYAKNHPDEIKVGFASPVENATNFFKYIAKKDGIKWKAINFNSEPEEIAALLGGHIDAFSGSGVAHTIIKDGRGRVLLGVTKDRIPMYPDVPTIYELYGLNAFQPNGLIAPAGVSKSVVEKLEKALLEATKTPEFEKIVDQMGCVVRFRSNEGFTEDINTTLETQRKLMKETGILRKDLQ